MPAEDNRLSVLQSLPSVFTEDQFVPIAENCEFLRKILEGRLSIPNFPQFTQQIDGFFNKVSLLLLLPLIQTFF